MAGRKRSRVYMVMEWCEGRLLREILDEGRISQDRAIRIAIEVLEALEYIHENGVVHRDLKPENIMVDDARQHQAHRLWNCRATPAARRLTYANFTATLGTADYISPEQVKGKRGDGRSDIYAMGIILYEMLTGKQPFTGSSPHGSDERPAAELSHSARGGRTRRFRPSCRRCCIGRWSGTRRTAMRRRTILHTTCSIWTRWGSKTGPELRDWHKRKAQLPRQILYYSALALIPVVILLLMVLIARHE